MHTPTVTPLVLVKLVLEYTSTDECTFSCTNTIPVLHYSAEDLVVDFEAAARAAIKTGEWKEFKFAGHTFSPQNFFYQDDEGKAQYNDPMIMTVDEWFLLYNTA